MPPKKSAKKEETAPAKKAAPAATKAKAPAAAVAGGEGNAALIKVFEALMFYESKDGNKWASVAYSKVIAALRSTKKTITSGSDVASSTGVGKTSVEKIDEFLSTGTIKKLDELKEMHGELPSGMLGILPSGGSKKSLKDAAAASGAAPISKPQLKLIDTAAEGYDAKSIVDLKAMLKANGQVQSGTKGELVQRCAEGKVLGAIPVCPLCGAGKLRFDGKTGIYKCPGYQDDDVYRPCVFQSGAVTRTTWKE